MMRKTPDEHGWYWAKSTRKGAWYVAHVDTGLELVSFFAGKSPKHEVVVELDDDALAKLYGPIEWHGPFACPGGPFGEMTVIPSAEMHERASESGKAIVIVHVDFKHCADEKYHSRITVFGEYLREDAEKLLRMGGREDGFADY